MSQIEAARKGQSLFLLINFAWLDCSAKIHLRAESKKTLFLFFF